MKYESPAACNGSKVIAMVEGFEMYVKGYGQGH